MNKKQVSLIVSMIFYIVVGLAACGIFFVYGSSRPVEDEILPTTLQEPQTIEEEAEVSPEPTVEETAQEEEKILYYKFLTINSVSPLNVRKSESIEAPVVGHLLPGSTGYVLEKGPAWSYIETDKLTGYVFNEYLEFEEISEEEFLSR